MRIMVVAAAVSLSFVGLAVAQDAGASIKRPVSIEAQGLETALKAFAQTSGLQIVYVSEDVRARQTGGAAGDFTPEEALRQILGGTGLTPRGPVRRSWAIAFAFSFAKPSNKPEATSARRSFRAPHNPLPRYVSSTEGAVYAM